MKNNDYEIYIQDHHVGYARDVTDDMPNTGGRFEPKPEFEDYRLLFEQEMHFLKHKNYRAHEELMDAILRLAVH